MSNEVKEGYKKTAIGIIPEDWEISSIEEIGEVTGGSTPRRTNPEYWGGDIPWLTLSQISDELINTISETEEYRTEAGLENSSAKLLPKGTVMLSSRATIGECLINEVPMTTNQGFANIICDKEKVDNYFLMYLLRYNKPRLEILGAGSTFSEVSRTSVRSFNVPVLPLPEQKKIADILSSVDQAIEKTGQIIAKTKELKQGLMQELLTKGIGHDEFKEVRIGVKKLEIPINWEVANFGDIYIKRNERSKTEEEYNYVSLGHMETGNLKLMGKDNNGQNRSSNRVFKEGDVLYGKLRPYLRKGAIAEFEGICSTDIIPLYSTDKSINEYLIYVVHSKYFVDFAISTMEGTNLPRTSWSDIKKLNIPIPPLEEQKKIANILSSVDSKIQKKQEQKEKLEELKKGLMQKLLTGEVRVDVEE